MTWSYRVLRRSVNEDTFYEIHEVFYGEDGKPDSSTVDGVGLGSKTAVGLALTLPMYLKALSEPVLDHETYEEVEAPVSVQALTHER